MCGIIGYYSEDPKPSHKILFNKLVQQSKIRGLHSFGWSWFDKCIKTYKKHDINDFKFPVAKRIIFHNRYSTSGDYLNHNNNQPIHTLENSVVFNGVIDMGTKEEMEKKYNVKMNTENDAELINLLCGNNKAKLNDFIKKTPGSVAGMMLTNEGKLYVFRNENRPAWVLNYDGAIFIASTRDIFLRSDKNLTVCII